MDKINFNKALEFHQKNNLDKAIAEYKKILKLCEKDESINFYLGTAYLQKENYINAKKYLNIALSINKDNFHTLSNLGILYKNKGDFNKAISFFKKSINLNPKFEHNYNNIANCFIELNKFNDALENYNKAIALNSLPDFLFNKANLLEKKGDFINAIDILEGMHQKNILNLVGYRLFIKILNKLNNFQKINDLFKNILSNVDNNDSFLTLYIDNLLAIDEPNKALDFVQKLHDKYLKKFYEGLCYYKAGNLEKSLLIFNKIKGKKDDNNLMNNIGLIHKDNGDYETAEKIFSNILENDPTNPIANTNLGLIKIFNKEFSNGFYNYQHRNVFYDPIYFPVIKRLKRFFNTSSLKNKKFIVIPEQGIGDQVLFYKSLHFATKNMDFIVEDRLFKILKDNFEFINFFKKSNMPNIENYDGYTMLADFFGETLNEFEPYLKEKILKKNCDPNSNLNKYTFGISWKSFNKNIGINKSLRLESLINLIPNDFKSSIVNLQYGDIFNDISKVQKNSNTKITIPDIDFFNDIESLIDLILSCRYVITTSNITAHLAGSYGKETFLLCSRKRGRHWYWHNNKICMYYPNTHLYFIDFDDPESSSEFILLKEEISSTIRDNL